MHLLIEALQTLMWAACATAVIAVPGPAVVADSVVAGRLLQDDWRAGVVQGQVDCQPRDFTPIGFDVATLVRSNLGGKGGRCETDGLCEEYLPAANAPSATREVLYKTVGFTRPPLPYEAIDLRITNESEYRAWRVRLNGIKRRTQGDITGYFGVINLLGPRALGQSGGPDTQWNTEFTYCELRYTFVGRNSGNPIAIDRTYLTFYDVRARTHELRTRSLCFYPHVFRCSAHPLTARARTV